MGQVQGLIPGMKREEDVPDPAPQAEGEYQEYAVSFFLNFLFMIQSFLFSTSNFEIRYLSC